MLSYQGSHILDPCPSISDVAEIRSDILDKGKKERNLFSPSQGHSYICNEWVKNGGTSAELSVGEGIARKRKASTEGIARVEEEGVEQ